MKDKRTLPVLLLILLVLAAGIVTAGCLYYGRQQERYRTEVEHKLAAIADLKVGEMSLWREERLGDAGVLHGNIAFSGLVRRWLDQPEDLDLQEELQTWISHIQEHCHYEKVALLDAQGGQRMSVPDTKEPICSAVREKVPEALRSGKVTFVDFHRNEHSQKIYLSLLVPLLDAQDGGRPLGVLVLRIDPNTYLYPFIQRWPTPAETAETLLVRREGNEVVFLNELKFQKNTALALRIPLESTRHSGREGGSGRGRHRGRHRLPGRAGAGGRARRARFPVVSGGPHGCRGSVRADARAAVADGPSGGRLAVRRGSGRGADLAETDSPASTGRERKPQKHCGKSTKTWTSR